MPFKNAIMENVVNRMPTMDIFVNDIYTGIIDGFGFDRIGVWNIWGVRNQSVQKLFPNCQRRLL
jgi:hypothetical protein